jgi:hypothetical protein
MKRSKLPRLTASEFQRVQHLTGLGPETLAMVRRVLVLGHVQNVVAAEVGITRQGVRDAVKKFVERYKELHTYASKAATEQAPGPDPKHPPGFVQVTLTAPRALAESWRKIAAKALLQARKQAAVEREAKKPRAGAHKRPAKTPKGRA